MNIKRKFVGVVLASLMSFSWVASASASPSSEPSISLDSTVPEGYSVVKVYDPTDESTKVNNIKVEGKSVASEIKSLQNTSEPIHVLDDTEIEVLKNETHLYRELQNINTGEVVPQYITEMVVASDSYQYGGSHEEDKKRVKLTITLYYHVTKYDSLDWIGLDKAYWRFDKGSKWTTDIIPYYGHKAQFAQIGPGINHQAQNQKQDATPNISGDVTFGETYLKVAPSSWVEVLNNGLATEVGLKTQANFIDQSLSSNRVF